MSEQTSKPIHRKKNQGSISFLLRLWRSDEHAGTNWQASLEVPGSGKRIGFASLEQLFAYLMDFNVDTGGEQRMGE